MRFCCSKLWYQIDCKLPDIVSNRWNGQKYIGVSDKDIKDILSKTAACSVGIFYRNCTNFIYICIFFFPSGITATQV